MTQYRTHRLNRAIALAAELHSGMVDKAGTPYIYHPLRVMFAVEDKEEQIAAVLHDTVEDCGISLTEIHDLFGAQIAVAIDHLTRREGENYRDFIHRCGHDPIALRVKLADLADNMNLERLGRTPTKDNLDRNHKYAAACNVLQDIAGSQSLR